MPGLNVTGGFSQLLSKDYEKVFFDEFMRFDKEYARVAKEDTFDGAYKKEGEMMGVKELQRVYEGQEFPYEAFLQGNEKELRPRKFGLGIQITQEMVDDDRTGHMDDLVTDLGKAADYSLETEYWDLLNSGFVTTNRTGIDSKALFADDHSTLDGETTIDNNGTAATLSTTALQAMYNYFETLVDERGRPIKTNPKILIIPPQLRWKAEELMLSEYNPENANMQYNTVKGLEYMICHYLTSTTAWFVLGDNHDLRFIWRKQLAYTQRDDFNTESALVKVSGRYRADFVRYRESYGNAGA